MQRNRTITSAPLTDLPPLSFKLSKVFQGLTSSQLTYFRDESATDSSCALHMAALTGDYNSLKHLLEEGVDVNSQDKEGTTALLLACRYNHILCVELLLKCDANPNAYRVETRQTCLHYAAQGGYFDVVKELIKYHAYVELCSLDGNSPFMLACECNHIDIVKLLYTEGAIIERKNFFGNTAMLLAARNGHFDIVCFLIEVGADVNTKGEDNDESVLCVAAEMGYARLVKELLKHGADVNYSNYIGGNPLHSAAKSGKLEIVELLIEAGANPCVKDMFGHTACEIANKAGLTHIFEYLTIKQAQKNSST